MTAALVNALQAARRALIAAGEAMPGRRGDGGAASVLLREGDEIEGVLARHMGLADRVGVYVASRASVPERPAMWRRLRDAGYPIISTWIDEAGAGETADNGELWARIAREISGAERLVLYVEPEDFPLKGALVEVGMAIAAGVPVVVVAPNVPLEVHTLRPLGSWAAHPMVTVLAASAPFERAFEIGPPCLNCHGGPQWGHRWDCPKCPD